MTDQALEYIESVGEDPYLLMLSLNPPHACFTDAPPEMKALYPDGSLPYRPNVSLENAGEGHISQRNASPHYEGYHAHITAVDRELARVLDTVAASPRARDTIVIYTSDHGAQFGSHGVGSKRQPFEESLRVPFLVHAPGRVRPENVSQALFGAQDVMPTLCGLAGIPVPQSCSGQDFSGHVLRGEGPEPDAQLIMHISKKNASGGDAHPAPLFRGARTARHTYAANENGPMYLFDNQADPYQMNNLVNSETHTGLRDSLHRRMLELLRNADDPFPN
jgi:arylsulfatase A-like enzyme